MADIFKIINETFAQDNFKSKAKAVITRQEREETERRRDKRDRLAARKGLLENAIDGLLRDDPATTPLEKSE